MHTKILITGGAGFVGSSLALAWKQEFPETHIEVLDNLKRRGSELNLPRLQESGILFRHGDIRNLEDLEAVGDMELLIECSAEPSVLAGYGGASAYVVNTNLMGTVNCLELARKHQADVVFLSTSRVYPLKSIGQLEYEEAPTRLALSSNNSFPGVSSQGFSEQFPLEGARSLYGATKLASELLLTEYIEMYGLRAVINRCGVLTGPWQMGKVDQGVIVLWMARHFFQKPLSYIGYGGTGKQVRDLLHVADLYDLLKIQCEQLDQHNGVVYNVGGGLEGSLSLQELTTHCERITGHHISIDSQPETRHGDIPYYVSDCQKIREATGWRPQRSVEMTLQEIADWIAEQALVLENILT